MTDKKNKSIQQTIEAYWRDRPEYFSGLYKRKSLSLLPSLVAKFLDRRTLALEDMIRRDGKPRLLDVGCGNGVHLKLLSGRARVSVGTDLSFKMLQESTKLLSDTDIRALVLQSDAQEFPFADSSFGLVIAMGVLDYVNNPELVLREIARVLSSDGQLVFSMPKRPSLFSWLRYPVGLTIRKNLLKLPPILHAYNKKSLISEINNSGLGVIEIRSLWTCMWMVSCERAG